MTFSVEPSIHHIAVNETDVIRLYRSTNPVSPPDPYFQGHPCQVYLCSAREGELLLHFIAILDITTKLPLIYRATCDAKDSAANNRLLAEAQSFIGSLGFSLEQMDLNYGTAMKQVVIRGLRIMRPPDAHRVLQSHPQNTLQPPQFPETMTPAAVSPAAEPDDIPAPRRTAPEPYLPVTPEMPSVAPNPAEQLQSDQHLQQLLSAQVEMSANLQRDLSEVRQQLSVQIQGREAAETALRQQTTLAATATVSAETIAAVAEIQRLETELAEETAQRTRLQQQCVEMSKRISDMAPVIDQQVRQLEQLQETVTTLELTQLDLQQECAQQQDQMRQDGDDLGVVRHELQQSDLLRQQLSQKVQQLEAALQESSSDHEAACAQWQEERQQLLSQLKSVSNRLERLSAEKKIWDSIAKNFRKKARVTVEKLRKDKGALQQELQRLLQRHPGGTLQVAAPIVAPAPVSPFIALGLTPLTEFSGFYTPGGGSSADFHHDPAIETVYYHSADEIIDLYGSGNVIQAAPFGRRSQACNAYVCVVEQQGHQLVYLAWQLIASGEVLFCVPELQPESAAGCARVLQDALFYFESVGFMMDRFELSHESGLQLQALEKTGVCRQRSIEAELNDAETLATAA